MSVDRDRRGTVSLIRDSFARVAWPSVLERQIAPETALVAAALLSGIVVRAIPVLAGSFPVNDGGLFASMIEDLSARGPLAPVFTTYNGGSIPFAYPPLALYLGAAIHSWLGVSVLDVLHYLPFIFSVLVIPAWFLVARQLVDRVGASVATLVFATVPRSYEWLISGGGITRSLGLLLAMLALASFLTFARSGRRSSLFAASLLGGLTALSHLEALIFLGVSGAVVVLHYRSWMVVGRWFETILWSALITVPWVMVVFLHHGVSPFTDAGGSRLALYPLALSELLSLQFTQERYVALGALLGAVGFLVTLLSGRWWLILWVLLLFLGISGGFPTYAMAPWSLLASIAVREVLLSRLRPRIIPFAASVGVVVLILTSVWAADDIWSPLATIPPPVRSAMEWVKANTRVDAKVLEVSGKYWAIDSVAEWLPYLTKRTSIGTVQGHEFSGEWSIRLEAANDLTGCAVSTAKCLDDWAKRWDRSFDIVFIPKTGGANPESDCCVALRSTLYTTPGFHVVLDDRGATIATRDHS